MKLVTSCRAGGLLLGHLEVAGNLAKQLCLVDALILDNLGYLPFPASGGALLLHLISRLYEKTSLIITTNLSFGEWVKYRGNRCERCVKRPKQEKSA